MKTYLALLWTVLLCGCSNGMNAEAGRDAPGPETAPTAPTAPRDSAHRPAAPGHDLARAPGNRAATYAATSYAAIEAEATRAGASLDSQMAHADAGRICGAGTRPKSTFAESVETSYRELARFQSRFCGGYAGQVPAHLLELVPAAAKQGDRDALVIQELWGLSSEAMPEEIEDLRAIALQQARVTSSASAYRIIHEELLGEAFQTHHTSPISFLDESEASLARGLGVAIASCDRFGGCGAGSILVMAYCQPFNCAPGHDMRAHVRSRLTARGFEEALRYAREIQSATPQATR